MSISTTRLAAWLLWVLVAWATPATAQDDATDPVPALTLSATATMTSDYRFRGISLSNRNPAVQGSVELEHRSGLYAGTWASSIAKFAGTRAEVDVYAGVRKAVAGLDLDLGGVMYLYPGGHGGNYGELSASASKTLGPVTATAGLAYAPSQKNIGRRDNRYGWVKLSSGVPGTPVTLSVRAAHEKGSLAGPTARKWDWSAGAELVKHRFRFSLEYQDTSIRKRLDPTRVARGAVVAMLSVDF